MLKFLGHTIFLKSVSGFINDSEIPNGAGWRSWFSVTKRAPRMVEETLHRKDLQWEINITGVDTKVLKLKDELSLAQKSFREQRSGGMF